MSPTEIILQVSGLHISYGNFRAVKNVGFEVRAGEIFGLLARTAQAKLRR